MPAADLQPSWNDPTVMVEAANLNLLTTEQAKERMSVFERLRAPQANTEGLSVAFHTVPNDSFTVVGERGGITYAVWKDGTAGNMPIKHYYEVHDTEKNVTVSADFKAVLRRSSKIWSKHLVDDGLRHDVTLLDGKVAKNISGIILQTRLNDKGRNSAWVLGYHGKDGNGYRPYNGKITISLHLHDDLSDWIADTVAHEIGHVLGITRKGTELYEGTYYDVENHTWNGPNVLRETNGKPVPLQWVSVNESWRYMEPHAQGARRDVGHFGDCVSLLAYCSDHTRGGSPSKLDLAFLADIGLKLVDQDVAAETERYGRVSWGEWAVWGASVERDLKNNFQGNPKQPHDFIQARAEAFGVDPDSNLSERSAIPYTVQWKDGLHSNTSGNLIGSSYLAGEVTWEGSLHGVDMSDESLFPVVGKASLRVDLFSLTGTVRFSDLKVYQSSNTLFFEEGNKAFREPVLSYAIKVNDNGFSDVEEKIDGRFFGPVHQEMAGTVNDGASAVQLLGGFGGTRIDP